MDRRLMIAALGCWPACHVLAQDDGPRPSHKVTARQLHEAMSARFPLRLGVGGLLELEVTAPRLLLLPARQRLGAALAVQIAGAQLRAVEAGEMEVVFALRYEPADQSIRAHRLEILDLRWPGLAPDASRTLRRVLPAVAREAVGEFVLHRFTPRELALADTLGFEPDQITVVDDGVVLGFGRKPSR